MEAFHDHFSDQAAAYAQSRPVYPVEFARALAGLCDRREVCWDVGCGSGQLSVLLAGEFERVVATDASAEQLARAPRRTNVEFRCELAHRTSLTDRSVDLIVAAQSAHWFDLPAFYAEARRVARARAVLALVCYARMTIDAELDRVVDPFYFDVLAPYWPPERAHIDTDYRELPFPFAELPKSGSLCDALEMHAHWTVDEVLGYIATWSSVRALERAGKRAAFEDFALGLRSAWAPHSSRKLVVWPLALRLTRLDESR